MRFLMAAIVFGLSACHSQALLEPLPVWQSPRGLEHVDLGRIRDLRSGEQLNPAQLLARLAVAVRVLIGEQHDNPDHHALELWLLTALEQQRKPGSLLLEMLDSTQQPLLDQVAGQMGAGRLAEDLDQALHWNSAWPWAQYGPIVQHGLSRGYALRAGNLDSGELLAIYREQPILQGEASTSAAVREPLLAHIRESHCNKLPENQLPAMLAVQQQRDRRMAERLLQAPEPAVLLAGSFHVRRDLGVPLHLRDLGARGATAVLILAEVGKNVTANQADYVWYTAALPVEDYCSRFP
jgi:uncharacterized iron-regulated protein